MDIILFRFILSTFLGYLLGNQFADKVVLTKTALCRSVQEYSFKRQPAVQHENEIRTNKLVYIGKFRVINQFRSFSIQIASLSHNERRQVSKIRFRDHQKKKLKIYLLFKFDFLEEPVDIFISVMISFNDTYFRYDVNPGQTNNQNVGCS